MKPLEATRYIVSIDSSIYIFVITECISESFHCRKSGHNREANCCPWTVCPLKSQLLDYSGRSVLVTFCAHFWDCAFTWTAFHFRMHFFPLHLPDSFLFLMSLPPTPDCHRDLQILLYVLIVPFSELLLSLAFDESLIDVDVNFPETHWAGRGITEPLVQPPCFIDKETVLQRVTASHQRSFRESRQGRTRVLASWLLVYTS